MTICLVSGTAKKEYIDILSGLDGFMYIADLVKKNARISPKEINFINFFKKVCENPEEFDIEYIKEVLENEDLEWSEKLLDLIEEQNNKEKIGKSALRDLIDEFLDRDENMKEINNQISKSKVFQLLNLYLEPKGSRMEKTLFKKFLNTFGPWDRFFIIARFSTVQYYKKLVLEFAESVINNAVNYESDDIKSQKFIISCVVLQEETKYNEIIPELETANQITTEDAYDETEGAEGYESNEETYEDLTDDKYFKENEKLVNFIKDKLQKYKKSFSSSQVSYDVIYKELVSATEGKINNRYINKVVAEFLISLDGTDKEKMEKMESAIEFYQKSGPEDYTLYKEGLEIFKNNWLKKFLRVGKMTDKSKDIIKLFREEKDKDEIIYVLDFFTGEYSNDDLVELFNRFLDRECKVPFALKRMVCTYILKNGCDRELLANQFKDGIPNWVPKDILFDMGLF